MKSVFSYIIAMLVFSECYSIEYISINKASGLPSNEVYDITQDKKGFIWIATEEGICKYDGKKFYSYYNKHATSKSGSYIKLDANDNLWYQNFDGNIINIKNDSLRLYNSIKYLPEFYLNNNTLMMLKQDQTIEHVDINTRVKKSINPLQKFSSIIQSEDLYTIYNSFVEVYNKNGILIDSLHPNKGNVITKVIKYKNNYYSIESNKKYYEVYKFNSNKCKELLYRKILESIVQCFKIIDNKIWIGSRTGLVNVDLSSQKDVVIFEGKNISNIYKDRDNNYWVSTLGEGIFLLPNKSNYTYEITHNECKIKNINNLLWLTSKFGTVEIFDPKTKTIIRKINLATKNRVYDIIPVTNLKHYINNYINKYIMEVIEHNNTTYLIGSSSLKKCIELDEKYLLFATSSSTMCFLKNQEKLNSIWDTKFRQYKDTLPIIQQTMHSQYQSYWVPFERSKDIVRFRNSDTILNTTSNGLFFITPSKTQEIKFESQKINGTLLCSYGNFTYCLRNDGEIISLNEKLLATFSNELNKYAPYNFIKTINHNLVAVNQNNIYLFDLLEPSNKHNTIDIGNSITEFSDIEYINGKYYVIAKNKIIETESLQNERQNKFPFYINFIQTNKTTYRKLNKLNFNSDENNISIHYSVINFLKNNFSAYYAINDNDWKPLETNSSYLKLASLNAGDYSISFKIDNTLYINAVNFSIKKPWYLRTTFLIGSVLAITFIIYFRNKKRSEFQKEQSKLLLQKAQLEKELHQSTLSGIKSQMNPHFLFNALNTIQSFIINEDAQNASMYLSKFSRLTRKILEQSELETITVAEEIDSLKLYLDLEKMRFEDLHFEILVDPIVDKENTRIPSMLIQPFVENSIKHGLLHKKGNKKLFIHFSIHDKILKILIDDNGVGRTKSSEINKNREQHISFANKANTKRIELLKRENKNAGIEFIDKMDDNNNPVGTSVIIKLEV